MVRSSYWLTALVVVALVLAACGEAPVGGGIVTGPPAPGGSADAEPGVAWSNAVPVVGPFVTGLAASGSTLYAMLPADANSAFLDFFGFTGFASGSWLFRSDDRGATWGPVYGDIERFDACGGVPSDTRISLGVSPADAEVLLARCTGYNAGSVFVRSANGGSWWDLVEDTLIDPAPFVFHPDVADYVRAGRMYSTDGGFSWRAAPYSSIWFHPADPARWVSFSASSSVYPASVAVSTDAGASWVEVATPALTVSGITRIAVGGGGRIYLVAAPTTSSVSVYASDDFGESWELRYSGSSLSTSFRFSSAELHVSPSQQDMLVGVYANSSTLSVSMDGGVTWGSVLAPAGVNGGSLLFDPENAAAFALRAGSYFYTLDGGLSWSPVEGVGTSITTLPFDGQTLVFIGGNELYGYDTGQDSTRAPRGILASESFLEGLVPLAGQAGLENFGMPRAAIPADAQSHVRVSGFLSTDGGRSWESSTFRGRAFAQSPAAPTRWYVSSANGVVRRSDDGARSDVAVGQLPSNYDPIIIAPSYADASLVYALTEGGVYRSEDAGVSWAWASAGMVGVAQSDLVVVEANDDLLYVGGEFGVHKSVDNGGSWQLRSNGLMNEQVVAVAASRSGATVYAGTATGSVYRSLDGASTWQRVNADFRTYRVTDVLIDPTDERIVYAATIGGVYKSLNSGTDWSLASEGMRTPFVAWLAITRDGQTLYAGTKDQGMYRGVPAEKLGAAFPTATALFDGLLD